MEEYFFPGCAELVSSHWGGKWWHKDFPLLLWDTPQKFVCNYRMFEECAPTAPVARLLDHSGFDDSVVSFLSAASDDILKIMFLGCCYMWNNAVFYGGRIWLKCFVSLWSDLWKSLERESAMMFSVTWMCCEYRDISLMTSVHPSQNATALWDYAFTGLYALWIQQSAL